MANEENKQGSVIRDESYYDLWPDDSQFASDLLSGAIRIYQVPQKYRVDGTVAYIYAMRFAKDVSRKYGKEYMETEKKLIENCLLHDIIDMYQNEETIPLAEELRRVYGGWYPGGTINSIGLM